MAYVARFSIPQVSPCHCCRVSKTPTSLLFITCTTKSDESWGCESLWTRLGRSSMPHSSSRYFTTYAQSLSMSMHPGMFTIWGTRASAASWGLFWYGMEQTHSYVNLVSSLKVDTGENSWKATWGMAPPSWSTLSLVLKLSHAQKWDIWGEHVIFHQCNWQMVQIFRTKRQCFACCLTNYTFSM